MIRRPSMATLRADLLAWHRRPALVEQAPGLPLYHAEIAAARALARRGEAVLVSIDGRDYLQPATE